jgi:hypothetical protein
MTVDQLASEIKKWFKLVIGLALLALIAVTGIELLGFNIPGIQGIPLTQQAGIGAAGIGFLYSKL